MSELLDFPEQTESHDIESNYVLHRRFDRMGRLIGDIKMQKLMNARVMVVGLGGVGSWAAEAIARSGVGKLHLVDFDEVCITNSNRQLPAISGNIGKKKAEVLRERVLKINPQIKVEAHIEFFNKASQEKLLAEKPDYVIDAIDNVNAKCCLLAACREAGIKVISCCGSAGKMDPTQIEIIDLSNTDMDPLAAAVRKMLRSEFSFPREGESFGIPAVYSKEPMIAPKTLDYDKGMGFKCVCPQGQNDFNSCDRKSVIYGSAGFVTGTFGLFAASLVIKDLTEGSVWQ